MNILIKNVDIITNDPILRTIINCNIGIRDGIIEFLSCMDNNFTDFKVDKVIEGKNKIAMPGLINTHTHSAMTLLRNFAGDKCLEDWLFNYIFKAEARLTPDDVYWGTLLGIAEMIKSGTTSFVDMYLFMDIVAQAASETGIRAVMTNSPVRLSTYKEEFQGTIDYYNRWNNSSNGRIKVFIEVHSVYLFNEILLQKAALLAKELNTGIVIHILETANEKERSLEMYGMNSAEVCEKTGIFDVPVIAAHCVHLTDNDIEIFKRKNVNVSHNPTSNLKLGSGIANIPKMIEKGINVCLGTDGAASNNNLNMFEEMNLAALIHKGVNMDPLLINTDTSIRLATVNGACALGFKNNLGIIKEGAKADIILIDTKAPHMNPITDLQSAIVYSTQASDVDTVIVDGDILMENRELKTIDLEKVIFNANKISNRILKGI